MQATVRHVFLKTKHGAPMVPVQQCTAVAEKGLVGDVSFGRRGVLARVERGGLIRIGDPISIEYARA